MNERIKLKSELSCIYEFAGPFELDRVSTQIEKLRIATLKLAEAIDKLNKSHE